MPAAKYKNNAWATLASGISDADTAIALSAGHGARFPALSAGEFFFATLKNSSNALEVIKVTARSTDSLTAVRGQDGTTAIAYSAGDRLELRWCSAYIDALFGGGIPVRTVDTISANTTLTSADKGKSKVITATATVTLPAATDLEIGESIEFKSTTTGKAIIARQGGDTLDGLAADYQLPSYCKCVVTKTGTGAYTLMEKPDCDVGDTKPWPTATAPTGWALCGTNYSRATYAGLFNVLGTTFGAGDGSTTFGAPDVRGRAIIGKDDMGGSAANRITAGVSGITGTSLGAAGGDQNAQAHGHSASSSVSDAGHVHGENAEVWMNVAGHQLQPVGGGGVFGTTESVGARGNQNTKSATTGISVSTTVNSTGSGNSQNVQPSIVMNYIVKT